MGNTKSKKGHKALLSQYIKEIENPDKHGFIGGCNLLIKVMTQIIEDME